MSQNETPTKIPAAKPPQVDEYAESIFKAMGFDDIPNGLAEKYNAFKQIKDKIHPGRLSPEGFAMVVVLFMMDGKE